MSSTYFCVFVLLLIAFLSLGYADEPPIVGSNPCTYGPTYWCANAVNAEKCGITAEHCAERYGGFKEQ